MTSLHRGWHESKPEQLSVHFVSQANGPPFLFIPMLAAVFFTI
jgi:hypothetical protein